MRLLLLSGGAMLAAIMMSNTQAECYPPYADVVLRAQHPEAPAGDPMASWDLSDTGGCVVLTWHMAGTAPTVAEIEAAAPAALRLLCAAAITTQMDADLAARRNLTWPGVSGDEVAISIAAGEPTPAVVADYLGDRAAIKRAYQDAIATVYPAPAEGDKPAVPGLTADAAWTCIQSGGL